MIKRLFFLFLIGIQTSVFGQNTPRYSQFNFVKTLNNPGALATDATFQNDLIYRNQWAGIDGAPSTIGFSSSYEIIDEMAVGINFYNDRIGLTQTNSFTAMYAYRLLFEERRYLSLGIGLGFDNFSQNFADATTTVANDPSFSQSYSNFKFNAAFGMYYRSSNFYFGLSIPRLLQNALFVDASRLNPSLWHYQMMTGFYWEIGDNFVLNPNFQFKGTYNAPLQGDALIRGIFNHFGASVGYRTENSIIVGLDYTFAKQLRVGYAFNYDVGPLARVKGMSNEVYLGFAFPYYFNGEEFDSRKYVGRKGNTKYEYNRKYGRHLKNKRKY